LIGKLRIGYFKEIKMLRQSSQSAQAQVNNLR
jgi:hypothetical protein